MLTYREGESLPFPFRSARYFTVNGEWYFTTREAPAFGPFTDRTRAEAACTRFLNRKALDRQRKRGNAG